MNLIFRMIWVFIASFFKPRISSMLDETTLRLRVMPNDLDINMHMNNGRYFTIMDLGRFDLVLRTGLMRMMMNEKSVPILGSAKIRFRLPLMPFEPFDLVTRVVGWDDKWAYIEQKFIKVEGEKAGAIAAIAILKGSFYSNKVKATVPTQDLLASLGHTEPSPQMPDYVVKWQVAEDSLRDSTR